jgi:hypothetical protein
VRLLPSGRLPPFAFEPLAPWTQDGRSLRIVLAFADLSPDDPLFCALFGESFIELSRDELLRASDPKPAGARPRSVESPCADHERPLRPLPESGAVRMCDCGLSCESSRWRAVMPP